MQPLRVAGDDTSQYLRTVSRPMLVRVAEELHTAHRAGDAGIAYDGTVPPRPDGHRGVWAPTPHLARRWLTRSALDELEFAGRRARRRQRLQQAFAAAPPE